MESQEVVQTGEIRKRIQHDIEEFLKKGGRIEVLDYQMQSNMQPAFNNRSRAEKDYQSRMRGAYNGGATNRNTKSH